MVMGTKLAPSYANIFMSNFEDEHVYSYQNQPLLWKRFTDDIFLIWLLYTDKLAGFITHLNQIYPTIKFISETLYTEVSFLDLLIYIINGTLYTRLYIKPTDKHMYLDYHSDHPLGLKNQFYIHNF